MNSDILELVDLRYAAVWARLHYGRKLRELRVMHRSSDVDRLRRNAFVALQKYLEAKTKYISKRDLLKD